MHTVNDPMTKILCVKSTLIGEKKCYGTNYTLSEIKEKIHG